MSYRDDNNNNSYDFPTMCCPMMFQCPMIQDGYRQYGSQGHNYGHDHEHGYYPHYQHYYPYYQHYYPYYFYPYYYQHYYPYHHYPQYGHYQHREE